MRRGGLIAVVPATLLVLAACSNGGAQDTTPSERPTLETLAAESTVPATLGLTPLETVRPTTTVRLTTLEELPGEDVETTTTAAAATTATNITTTTNAQVGGGDLPIPEPAPIPEAFEQENQIGSLEIPALSVAQKLFEGVTLATLDAGPGHWPGTALPGQKGNVVIAGHRTSHTKPFYDLDKLKKGDEVILNTSQGRNVYVVAKVQVISPNDTWIIDQTPAKTATLFACHPKGSTSKRIVAFLNYAPERSNPTA